VLTGSEQADRSRTRHRPRLLPRECDRAVSRDGVTEMPREQSPRASISSLELSDSSSGPDRADARQRRCFAQRPRLGSGLPPGRLRQRGVASVDYCSLLGRRRLPRPQRLRKRHGDGAPRNPRRVDSRTAGTMQQSATRYETTPSRSKRHPQKWRTVAPSEIPGGSTVVLTFSFTHPAARREDSSVPALS
jgi:hypothetical protein